MSRLEDAWARIGVLLALLQHVEHEINVSLERQFPGYPVTLEQIASFKKSKRKKTLGRLLRTLRERTPIESGMDRFLSTFLEDRNRFVHRLFTERDYNINNPKHVSRIRKFLDSLIDRSMTLDIAFHTINEVLAEEHDSVPDRFQWPPALKLKKGALKRNIAEGMRLG
jgi:hypothetical protein